MGGGLEGVAIILLPSRLGTIFPDGGGGKYPFHYDICVYVRSPLCHRTKHIFCSVCVFLGRLPPVWLSCLCRVFVSFGILLSL